MELIEISIFTRQITQLVDHDEYADFQPRLVNNPDLGALIPGGAGLRKVRLGLDSRGKRGGARVIYYWAMRRDLILPVFAYAKNQSADLRPKQLQELVKIVKAEFGK